MTSILINETDCLTINDIMGLSNIINEESDPNQQVWDSFPNVSGGVNKVPERFDTTWNASDPAKGTSSATDMCDSSTLANGLLENVNGTPEEYPDIWDPSSPYVIHSTS